MLDEIICALSGITPSEEDLLLEDPPLPTWIPTGWIKVTVERKYPNPQWLKLQTVKQGLIEATLQQVPEEQRALQRENVEIQVDAQYSQLEGTEKYKKTITEKEVAYISPPESDDELMGEYQGLLELLGLEYEDEDGDQEAAVEQKAATQERIEEPAIKEEEAS